MLLLSSALEDNSGEKIVIVMVHCNFAERLYQVLLYSTTVVQLVTYTSADYRTSILRVGKKLGDPAVVATARPAWSYCRIFARFADIAGMTPRFAGEVTWAACRTKTKDCRPLLLPVI